MNAYKKKNEEHTEKNQRDKAGPAFLRRPRRFPKFSNLLGSDIMYKPK
jgi:hypothetical protein